MTLSPGLTFAFATDDRTLLVFDNRETPVAKAEGIDVEEGMWLFFDAVGYPLEPVFTRPNTRGWLTVSSGTYYLQRAQGEGLRNLFDCLDEVVLVEGAPTYQMLSQNRARYRAEQV
jgi:hypothetical protein